MKITEDMVIVFNQTLENLGCSFKLQYDDKALGFGNPSCEIVPTSNMFIQSSIINVTDEFYNILDDFFAKRGIELTYNNTGSILWSKDGWKDDLKQP